MSHAPVTITSDDLARRLDVIRQLLRLFQLERRVYVGVTLISLLMLLASAGSLIYRGSGGPVEMTGLFGSAGTITYTAGRLLRMWNDALRALQLGGAESSRDERP